jgi:hypothetical protein
LIFIYSGLFSAEKDNHPVPSFYREFSGDPAVSNGLSRSFSEIIRGRFKSAREYNPYGISVFIFFLVQFFQRFSASFIIYKKYVAPGRLVIFDAILSICLFLFCFRGFILALIENFR